MTFRYLFLAGLILLLGCNSARTKYLPNPAAPGFNQEGSDPQAIAIADEVMIGGGGVLYQALMGRADRLYITHVALSPPGDTRFPPIDPAIWQVTDTPEIAPSAKDTASFRIKVYDRAAH